MNFQHKLQRLSRKLVLAVILASILVTPSEVQAYKSNPINSLSPGISTPATSILIPYQHLDSTLGIQSSSTLAAHAIYQWSTASWFTIYDSYASGTSVSQTTNHIRAVYFDNGFGYQTGCGNTLNFYSPAVVALGCQADMSVYLNADGYWSWNTQGIGGTAGPWSWECWCYSTTIDFLDILLHEFGHVLGLGHVSTPTTSVMRTDALVRQTLDEDDKRAATQFFGAYTGWETNVTYGWFPGYSYTDAMGYSNSVRYQRTVVTPQLLPISAELGITPYQGSRYLKLYGIPQTTYSYAYMTLFTADADELGSNPRHLKLTSTSQLSWAQYNSAQSKMSVDIIFTDGTTLRDSGLTDQGGVRVHPELRGVYATGVWYFFHVNLAPLAGKRVQHILIAYDSGGGNPTVPGTFRGYFDNVQLTFF